MALQSASPFRWQVEEIHHLDAHPVGHEPIPFSLRGSERWPNILVDACEGIR